MHLIVIFLLLFSAVLSAEIYDEYKLNQDSNKSKNYFFSNDFDEIIRFDAILFEDDNLTTTGSKTLKDITYKINSYKDGKRNFFVSVIGHTQATTDDKNEKSIDSKTYANRIQNTFRDPFDTNQSRELSQNYAKKIKKYLLDNGVEENIIEIEYRKGLDIAFSDDTLEGKALSNRVMIALYVEENLDLDDDGVVNSRDFCPNTKKGIRVDKDGCKFKSIILLVDNNKNKNAIIVSTKQNSITIDSPKDYSYIKSKHDTTRLYKRMPDKDIQEIFSDVLESNDVTKFTIYFNAKEFLDSSEKFYEIIEFLSKKPDSYVLIVGHTDAKGSYKYNEELAKKRADAVAKRIKDSGVEYLYIQVESYGEYDLATKTENGVREALNRRVEVLIR